MGEYFDARTEIGKAFIDQSSYQGNLDQNTVDNFDQEEALFSKLVGSGEKFTLSERNSSGEYQAIDEAAFNDFINKAAKEYGIDLSKVSDDSDFMFKVLDENGDGILQSSELKVLSNSDQRGQDRDIDGYTLGRYFLHADKATMQEEIKIAKHIEAVRNGDLEIEDLEVLYGADSTTIEYIKKQANGAGYNGGSSTLATDEQVKAWAGKWKEKDDAKIKAKLQVIYPDASETDIDALVAKIRAGIDASKAETDASKAETDASTP